MTYPRAFSHVGISVTDIEQAVEFYTKTFGWYVIMAPTEIVSDDSAIGIMCDDVFGEGQEHFKIAYLSSGAYQGKQLLPPSKLLSEASFPVKSCFYCGFYKVFAKRFEKN